MILGFGYGIGVRFVEWGGGLWISLYHKIGTCLEVLPIFAYMDEDIYSLLIQRKYITSKTQSMNKPKAYKNLIPVRDYAATYISRRGFPVTVQYIYKLIKEHKEGKRSLPFNYVELDKAIWIKAL